jgi:DNA-binding NarL/FixJ family response regulator
MSGKILRHLRILIADDHEVVRRGLRSLFSSRPGWIVCAEATNGREAVNLASHHHPDIIVMDISMPELNGLEATRTIRQMLPKTAILVLSFHFTVQLVQEVVDAGAQAYILKSDADGDLLNAVEALAKGGSFFTRRAAQLIIDGAFDKASEAILMRKRLASREREILQLLAGGKRSKDVAITLGISVKTADTHRSNIMRKLGMHSVGELVRFAVKHHMIEP